MVRCVFAFAVLVLSQQANSYVLPSTRVVIPPRTTMLRMEQNPEPFSTECVHVFDANLANGKTCQLALTRVSDDRKAKLAFWRFAYEHEAGGDASKLARAEAELRATMALSSGPSSMTFGAFMNGLEREEDGIALVRVEEDTSDDKKVMIIDALLVSPRLPTDVRPVLHSFIVKSLRAIGEAEQMTVRLSSDFDI